MKIAINGQQLSHFPLDQVLQVAKELGAAGIELWPENLPGGDDGFRWRGKDVVSAGAQVSAANLEVACVTLGFFALPRSTSRSDAATSVIEALDAAQQLGARLVNVYLAGVPGAEFTEVMRLVVPRPRPARSCRTGERSARRLGFPGIGSGHDRFCGVPLVAHPIRSMQLLPGWHSRFSTPFEVLQARIAYLHLKGGGNSTKGRTFIRAALCVTQREDRLRPYFWGGVRPRGRGGGVTGARRRRMGHPRAPRRPRVDP